MSATLAHALRVQAEVLLELAVAAEREAEAPATEPDPMLSVAEAADELGCSAAYVRAQCAAGAIKALKTEGGRYRVRRSALRRYERTRTGG